MWWSGRHPGLSDEEDRLIFEEERRVEQLDQDLINEITDLLGDALPPQIPSISFERVPGDCHGLVKPREIHVREYTKPESRVVPYRGSGKTPLYRITNTEASIVKQTLEYNGLRELTSNGIGLGLSPHDWVLQWSGPNYRDHIYQNLHGYQYVNHFSGSTEMTRKDRIWGHFQGMQRLFGKVQFDFIPETFIIPEQLEAFIQVYEKTNNLWIVKPHASSRGRGIFVLQELSEIPLDCLTVISRYIESPYLIQGLKFDLRLYVLVTGFDPLRIYLFKEGLTRFASSVFSTDEEDLGNVYKHLTNYSINKYASNFVENADASHDNVGHKWSLSALNKHLLCCNVDVKLCWSRIVDVIIKTILTVERPVVNKMKSTVSWRSNCFELYGFDLILDQNLKPHLLEVNLSPSMQADTPLDYKIKSSLVQETFNLLGPKLADQKQLGETRWKSRAKQLKRQGQRLPYGTPLASSSISNNQCSLLKPTVLNTPAARAREAERQQKFHSLQKKALPLGSLGEKPLRLLLECLQEFQACQDFIRVFPTHASVRRYGHMVGIGSQAKSMSATQLVCLALFNEPRFQKNRQARKKRPAIDQTESTDENGDEKETSHRNERAGHHGGEKSGGENRGEKRTSEEVPSMIGSTGGGGIGGGRKSPLKRRSSTKEIKEKEIDFELDFDLDFEGGDDRKKIEKTWSMPTLTDQDKGNLQRFSDTLSGSLSTTGPTTSTTLSLSGSTTTGPSTTSNAGQGSSSNIGQRSNSTSSSTTGGPPGTHSSTFGSGHSSTPGGGSTPASAAGSSTAGATSTSTRNYLNSKSFYWNTSVVSTESSKRGLEALERRINSMTGTDDDRNHNRHNDHHNGRQDNRGYDNGRQDDRHHDPLQGGPSKHFLEMSPLGINTRPAIVIPPSALASKAYPTNDFIKEGSFAGNIPHPGGNTGSTPHPGGTHSGGTQHSAGNTGSTPSGGYHSGAYSGGNSGSSYPGGGGTYPGGGTPAAGGIHQGIIGGGNYSGTHHNTHGITASSSPKQSPKKKATLWQGMDIEL